MFVRNFVRMLCGVVFLSVCATSATGAFTDGRRTTYFTFSRAVQLPGVVLPAGTYIFEVANHNGDGDIVRVLTRDRSRVHLMRFTRPIYRQPARDMKATITLGESLAGNPPPVKAWYAESEIRGREFLY
jgi:hypothetical protein